MFVVNEDNSIYVTRGDILLFSVKASNNGTPYTFKVGDVVRMCVVEKKAYEKVVLQKDFPITTETDTVEIYLEEADTKIGKTISKATDYWYEIVLNPETEPQTIVGYDDDGAKIFKLFPEGEDLPEMPITEEDIPIIDAELSLLSARPVENRAVTKEIVRIDNDIEATNESIAKLSGRVTEHSREIEVERARVTNLATLKDGSTTGDAELIDARTDEYGNQWGNAGNSIRGQVRNLTDRIDTITNPIYKEVTDFTVTYGFYNKKGEYKEQNNLICAKIPVTKNEMYYTKATYGYDAPDGVVLDAEGNFIKYFHSPEVNATANYDNLMVMPENAGYLCVNSYATRGLKIRTVDRFTLNTSEIEKYVQNVAFPLMSSAVNTTPIESEVNYSYVIGGNGELLNVTNSNPYYIVLRVPVNAGENIAIKASTHYGNSMYVFLDEFENVISKGEVIQGDALVTKEYSLIVPMGATSLLVPGVEPVSRRIGTYP